MECRDCSYRIIRCFEFRRDLGKYYCTHPGTQPEWNGLRFICEQNRDNGDMTIKRSPRWCPLLGYDKIEKGYEKLILAAFYCRNFDPIKKSKFLDDREKKIILEHYSNNKSISKIAKEMELSRYQVDRIERMAMDRVRLTLYNNALLDRKMDECHLAVETGGDLSVRSMTALIHNDLRTEEEITKYINQNNLEPVEALMQLKYIGKQSAEEIFNFLKTKGLY